MYQGNGTTAWNASLPNGLYFVTPLSYALLHVGDDKGLTFTGRDDNFTALAHFFTIYSNAGNVSYAGYNRSSDKTPWEFRAIETLYHACVITYETDFTLGNSTTRVLSTSSTLLPIESNRPLYNTKCSRAEDMLLNTCDFLDKEGGITYLQDPEAPNDVTKSYAFGRDASMSITYNLYFDLANSFMADGIDGNIASYSNDNYFELSSTVYGKDDKIRDPALQFDRLGQYFNLTAISLTNMLVLSSSDSLLPPDT